MSIYFSCKQTKRFGVFLCLIMAAVFLALGPKVMAQNSINTAPKKIIFLDPGHGGHDDGVRGANGGLEKRISFALAQELSVHLKEKYDWKFSRTDDYNLALFSRSEAANHLKADLFISIHAGGSFRHQSKGLTIFYFQGAQENGLSNEIPFESERRHILWPHVQLRHVPSSRHLATHIQTILINELSGVSCRVKGAPLVVLSGVDMPAVFIEIGYLTNPMEERRLNDPVYLSKLAGTISKGLDNFLANKSTISSIDLHE
jgi:N-acetylmuramoyl-L-alanine amidase